MLLRDFDNRVFSYIKRFLDDTALLRGSNEDGVDVVFFKTDSKGASQLHSFLFTADNIAVIDEWFSLKSMEAGIIEKSDFTVSVFDASLLNDDWEWSDLRALGATKLLDKKTGILYSIGGRYELADFLRKFLLKEFLLR